MIDFYSLKLMKWSSFSSLLAISTQKEVLQDVKILYSQEREKKPESADMNYERVYSVLFFFEGESKDSNQSSLVGKR